MPRFSICVYESPYGFRDWSPSAADVLAGIGWAVWLGGVARYPLTPPPTGTIGNKGEKMSDPAAAVEAPAPETPATSVADEPAAEGGAEGQSKKAAKKVRRASGTIQHASSSRSPEIAARDRREIRRRAAAA